MEPPPLTGGWIPRKYASTSYEEKSKLFELQEKFNLLKSENEHLKSQNEKASQKFKKQLKKQTKTIDKLTDLLSRYDKLLTKKIESYGSGWTVRDQSENYPKMEPITNTNLETESDCLYACQSCKFESERLIEMIHHRIVSHNDDS